MSHQSAGVSFTCITNPAKRSMTAIDGGKFDSGCGLMEITNDSALHLQPPYRHSDGEHNEHVS